MATAWVMAQYLASIPGTYRAGICRQYSHGDKDNVLTYPVIFFH